MTRSRVGLLVAGGVVIAGAVGVAVAELLRLPRGSVWLVVAATAALAAIIRAVTAPRR
jgi:hypothetical protein